MQGFTTLDLATVLGEAHREELTTALRTRPGPSQRWRAALGRRLVRTGNRLLDHSERAAPSPRAMSV
jgi:hypothetical protein